ncbi:hypothetical protein [Plantactinospora sp. CA-290183]|uniref:hypothetical protein n=1 Tax=Plantactinospora sp. CA-290183 TaxID=3240006 RepID=UPI003D90137D
MTRRLWWRVTDVLPLAEHAVATRRHRTYDLQRNVDWWGDAPALIWVSRPDGDLLFSNGIPDWYDRDGTVHHARAETWIHIRTGARGNPAQVAETHGILPLKTGRYLKGRRTLLDLLRYAARHELNWFGLDPDPASEETSSRYLVSRSRADVVPPDAIWIPATVTCEAVDGASFEALIADGYHSTLGAVLARFPLPQVRRMRAILTDLNDSDTPGDYPTLTHTDQELCVYRQRYDPGEFGCHHFEEDRVDRDADGYFTVGAHWWRWTLQEPLPSANGRPEGTVPPGHLDGGAQPVAPASDSGQVDPAGLAMRWIDRHIAAHTLPPGIGSVCDVVRYVDLDAYLESIAPRTDDVRFGEDAIGQIKRDITRRLQAPGRPMCTYGTCTFAGHDHTTGQGPDGRELDGPIPMRCGHCGQPAHYDSRIADYRHDDPAAADCFLIHRP